MINIEANDESSTPKEDEKDEKDEKEDAKDVLVENLVQKFFCTFCEEEINIGPQACGRCLRNGLMRDLYYERNKNERGIEDEKFEDEKFEDESKHKSPAKKRKVGTGEEESSPLKFSLSFSFSSD